MNIFTVATVKIYLWSWYLDPHNMLYAILCSHPFQMDFKTLLMKFYIF